MKIFREAKGLPEPEETVSDEAKATEDVMENTQNEELAEVLEEAVIEPETEETQIEIEADVMEGEDVHNEQLSENEKIQKGNVGIFSGRSLDD